MISGNTRILHLVVYGFLGAALGPQLSGTTPRLDITGNSKVLAGEPKSSTTSCWARQTVVVGSPIPSGWVITNEQTSGSTSYYDILNVSCAQFRDMETVLVGSPIPANWVITNEQSSGITSYYDIEYLMGAPTGDIETVLSSSPIPSGWVIISTQDSGNSTYYRIQNTNPPNKVTATITSPSSAMTIGSGTVVSFLGTGMDSDTSANLTYSWNFGDGNVASGASTSHAFTNSGTANAAYTVTLRVTDSTGVTGADTRAIVVTPAPPVAVSITPSSVSLLVPTRYPVDPIPGRPTPPPPSAAYQFQAQVLNASNQAVTWSISPIVGSISSTGLYTVPGDPQNTPGYVKTVTVTATSNVDSSKSATAIITLYGGTQNN